MFSENAKVFVDADSLFFRLCCVTKNKKEIRKGLRKAADDLRRKCMSDDILYAVKGWNNFRKELYPEYKANRKELDDDLRAALNYAHEFMVNDMGAVRADGMEADDLVSIWATEATLMGYDYVVAGIDKDLLQIPGLHYNYQKDSYTDVDVDSAHRSLMLQCLTGDTSDNIPGIKGVGPVKAGKILKDIKPDRLWGRVEAAWRGHRSGSAVLSWNLLTMLTSFEEYNAIQDAIQKDGTLQETSTTEERLRSTPQDYRWLHRLRISREFLRSSVRSPTGVREDSTCSSDDKQEQDMEDDT